MNSYSYEGVTRDGNIVTGTIEADDERLVISRLQDMDCYPLKVCIAEKGTSIHAVVSSLFGRKISEKDVMTFSYQLGVLLEAGFALDRSLSILSELTEKKLGEIISELLTDIKGGKSLSEALSGFPDTFPSIFVNMVSAGEAGGFLEGSLLRLANYLEESQKLKEDVQSALVYPTLLSAVSGAAVVVLLIFVIPRFADIFSDMGQALPLPTLILLSVSSAIKKYWWLIAGLTAAGAMSLRHYLHSDTGKRYWHSVKFDLPVLGKLYRELSVARFARTLGILIRGGVPILNALQIVEGTMEKGRMAELISSVREGVRKGKGIAGLLKKGSLFPAFAVHMVAVGEESGRLDEMLIKIADRFDAEVRSHIKKLMTLLEPALILFMGLVVGFIVISMLLAIFSLNELPF